MKIQRYVFPNSCTRLILPLLGLLLLAPLYGVIAQPSLNFKRVTVNWPTIEVYFDVDCGGQPFRNLTKDNFSIAENGVDVGDFTLWCPDPSGIRCAASLGIVLDASGSMGGAAALEASKIAGYLIELLGEPYDESALVLAGTDTKVAAAMTTEKNRLRDGLAEYAPSGASALYDGVFAGLGEMINNGVNQCRALIVVSDGEDNTSTHTMADVIALANRHRIRVITIGTGPIMQEDSLSHLAQLTGGRFLMNPVYRNILDLYYDITRTMWDWPQTECIITYERGCADGSLRTVDLRLRDVCGGSDAKNKQYRAPSDSSTMQNFDIILSAARVNAVQPFLIGIDIDPRGDTIILPPFELELRLDDALRYRSLSVPSGSALAGVPLQIDSSAGLLRIRSLQPCTVAMPGRLLDIELSVTGTPPAIGSLIAIDEMRVESGCYLPSIINHPVHALPSILLTQPLCEGGSAVLEGTPGFPHYLWSTGDTTRSILVTTAGSYGLRVVDERGDTLAADPVSLVAHPLPQVRVGSNDQPRICPGSYITLHLEGVEKGSAVRWSDGQEGQSIQVREAGQYWASATNQYGCVGYSDTMTVTTRLFSLRIVPSGVITLCPGDSVVLSLAGTFNNIRWNDVTASSTLTIKWQKPDPQAERTITVRASDSSGCSGYDTVVVRMLDPVLPEITPGPVVALCDGASVTLHAGSGLVDYRWSTGESTESIEIRQPGVYSVSVTDVGGCMLSDTVVVTSVSIPQPSIAMSNAGMLCGNQSVVLDAGAGWEGYLWNTGESTRQITTDSAGLYWVRVTGYGGCAGMSDTVHIIREIVEKDFLPTVRGSQPLCPGDTLWLDAPAGMSLTYWNTGDRNRSLAVTKAGRYAVTVVTPGGCETRSGFVDVSMTSSKVPVIVRSKDLLSTGAAQAWQWYRDGLPIPGATQQAITAGALGSYTVTIVDDYGCTMTSKPFIINVLGISAAIETDDLLLYPDPASDWLHVQFPAASRDARLTLVSLLGQVLARQETSGDGGARTMRIDLSALPAGVYLLHATAGERMWVRKVVKRNN